jgi:hypothetical protein
LIPVEAVLATVECKSDFNKGKIAKAVTDFVDLARFCRHFVPTAHRKMVRALKGAPDPDPLEKPIPALEAVSGIGKVIGLAVSLETPSKEIIARHMAAAPPQFALVWNVRGREVHLRRPDGTWITRSGEAAVVYVGSALNDILAEEVERPLHVRPRLDRYWSPLLARQFEARSKASRRTAEARRPKGRKGVVARASKQE